jgi:hypothetical protein
LTLTLLSLVASPSGGKCRGAVSGVASGFSNLMISCARTSTDRGLVGLSAFAVLTLVTSRTWLAAR